MIVAASIAFATYFGSGRTPKKLAVPSHAVSIPSLDDLASMAVDELAKQDIALLNLCSADGLPGAEGLDIAAKLKELDRLASRVRAETNRCLPHYFDKPEDFQNSEAYFRMLVLVTVLQQDLGVHYNPERISSIDFTQSQDLFIHGMVGSSNGGTCLSMPVLYTAVARRLGYPIFLVNAKEHLFCRWDGLGERVNIEGSSRGLNSYSDEHYMNWPHRITQIEIDRGLYLKSLSASESLAVFLAMRGHCLEDTGNRKAAQVCYSLAIQHSSSHPMYIGFKTRLNRPKTIEDFPQILAQQHRLQAKQARVSFPSSQH